MFRKSVPAEQPRFLQELLQALRESEDELAEADAADEPVAGDVETISDYPSVETGADRGDVEPDFAADREETETLRAEVAVLRELSIEWKEAVRLDREHSSYLVDLQMAA